jgi:hypothetical protein
MFNGGKLAAPVAVCAFFLTGNIYAGPITTFHTSWVVTCIGMFGAYTHPGDPCTTQATSSVGAAISNSGTITTTGETVNYSGSSVSMPGSLGGSIQVTTNTFNQSGPGIMVDALELMVDSITVDYPGYTGQPGVMLLQYTLHGTNSVSGSDTLPYACIHLGINSPEFPFGCNGSFTQASVNGTFSTGFYPFVWGQATPLWFALESIAGTGFGSGRATGPGSSSANFYNTATIGDLLIYDQNMNPLSSQPTITSGLGITYQDVNVAPEPSSLALFCAGLIGMFSLIWRKALGP